MSVAGLDGQLLAIITVSALVFFVIVWVGVGVTRARVTQVMNLLLLSPEIQRQILLGKLQVSERALRSAVGSALWTDQLEHLTDPD